LPIASVKTILGVDNTSAFNLTGLEAYWTLSSSTKDREALSAMLRRSVSVEAKLAPSPIFAVPDVIPALAVNVFDP
jgi:hypothetical protein